MYFKLAYQNVKKNWRDYTIYGMSLVLSIALFYSFHSLESQSIFMELQDGSQSYLEIIFQGLDIASLFVVLILGSMMVYANQIAMKKRTKELGIYMMLGMGKKNISNIFVMEATLVGLVALIVGLVFGVFGSFLLSQLSGFLFEIPMDAYTFVLSFPAFLKTVGFFFLLSILLLAFYRYRIASFTIIGLIREHRSNQPWKPKLQGMYLIAFIISVLSLGIAYLLILEVGLDPSRFGFLVSLVLGVLGTFLSFFSLGGVASLLQKKEGWYYKNLNSFALRQMTSKFHTHYRSMAMICLMLFVTMGVLASGLSIKSALEKDLKAGTPFDAVYAIFDDATQQLDFEQYLIAQGFPLDQSGVAIAKSYTDFEFSLSEVMSLSNPAAEVQEIWNRISNYPMDLITHEDFNTVLSLLGKEPYPFESNEIIFNSDIKEFLPALEAFVAETPSFSWRNQSYELTGVLQETLQNSATLNGFPVLIVPSSLLQEAYLQRSTIYVNYQDSVNRDVIDERFKSAYQDYQTRYSDNYDQLGSEAEYLPYVYGRTRTETYIESRSMSTLVLFLGLYLGMVFLIASMALLSIQLLHEAHSSKHNYIKLSKLGATKQELQKSMFQQVFLYFALPMSLALIHSVVGISVVNEFIATYNKPDITGASLLALIVFFGVFACYFIATYQGYQQIVFMEKQ
ncbi:MAG: FtsX-like permease family protein [Erysipelotrichaceae bacterium]